MTIELIAVLHVLLNTVIALVSQRKMAMSGWFTLGTLSFTVLWVGVFVGWLGWAWFVEIGAIGGTFMVIRGYNEACRIAKIREEFRFDSAKPTRSAPHREPRKPQFFDPAAKQLPRS